MFILVYGADGTGKSVQCKSIAEAAENAEHWSFATKNRRLYADSGIVSIELLKFNSDITINPWQTMDAFHDILKKTIATKEKRVIVIDEITLLRKWAQSMVIEEINKDHRAHGEPLITKIGQDNMYAWGLVNDYVYAKLAWLSDWAVVTDSIVIAITSLVEERTTEVGTDGKKHSVTTGGMVIDQKLPILKLADVRIKLEKDGKHGKGYYAIFEKLQDGMAPEGSKDAVKVDKAGLLTELTMRGVL